MAAAPRNRLPCRYANLTKGRSSSTSVQRRIVEKIELDFRQLSISLASKQGSSFRSNKSPESSKKSRRKRKKSRTRRKNSSEQPKKMRSLDDFFLSNQEVPAYGIRGGAQSLHSFAGDIASEEGSEVFSEVKKLTDLFVWSSHSKTEQDEITDALMLNNKQQAARESITTVVTDLFLWSSQSKTEIDERMDERFIEPKLERS